MAMLINEHCHAQAIRKILGLLKWKDGLFLLMELTVEED
jgi:hypothetical protein